jgi:hypothetical protein
MVVSSPVESSLFACNDTAFRARFQVNKSLSGMKKTGGIISAGDRERLA